MMDDAYSLCNCVYCALEMRRNEHRHQGRVHNAQILRAIDLQSDRVHDTYNIRLYT